MDAPMTKPEWKTPDWVPGHIEKYLTDPEAAHMWDTGAVGLDKMIPTLLLTTTGRKSGEPRHSPLIYQHLEGAYVVIGSKGGYPDHPAWYLNLLAAPEAEIRVGAKRLKVRARTTDGAERERLWDLMQEAYPLYEVYKARHPARPFPVIALEPIGDVAHD